MEVRDRLSNDITRELAETIRRSLPAHLIGRHNRSRPLSPAEAACGPRPARRILQSSQSTDPPKLLIGVLIIQSIKPKLQELTCKLDRRSYGVMLLSEIWLRPSAPERLLVIPGFSLRRACGPPRWLW